MPSVRNCTGTCSACAAAPSEEYGAEPLLCHVSSTYGSRSERPPHLEHAIAMRSSHGLWSSGTSAGAPAASAAAEISAFVKSQSVLPQAAHVHAGSGHPQNLSREMHHGCLSPTIARKRLRGCSKKYSAEPAALTAASPSLSSL